MVYAHERNNGGKLYECYCESENPDEEESEKCYRTEAAVSNPRHIRITPL